jgi:uncharacterized protein with GYD domain
MPNFLIQAAYTPEAIQAMIQNPQDRTAVIRGAIEKLGGKVHHLFLSFGDYDVVVLLEMPDNVAAAAIALAVAAGGACKTVKTTSLLTAAEGLEAAKKAATSGYRSVIAAKAAG